MKKIILIFLGVLLLVFIFIYAGPVLRDYFVSPDELAVKDVEERELEIPGHIMDMAWLGNDEIVAVVGQGDPHGYVNLSVLILSLQGEGQTILTGEGWRERMRILDVSRDGLVAISSKDMILVLDRKGNILHKLEETGTNTQALFTPDGEYLAYTSIAEWELPTNLHLLNLEDENKKQLTQYDFGQNFKVGSIKWLEEKLFFVEQYTYGTVALGGHAIYQVIPEKEPELVWEVPDEEQVMLFNILPENCFLILKALWDAEYIESQLYLARYDREQGKKWQMALDEMGDMEKWHKNPWINGYPESLEIYGDQLYITALRQGEYHLLTVDLQEGKTEHHIAGAGFPRISPSGHKLLFIDFSQEEPVPTVMNLNSF